MMEPEAYNGYQGSLLVEYEVPVLRRVIDLFRRKRSVNIPYAKLIEAITQSVKENDGTTD